MLDKNYQFYCTPVTTLVNLPPPAGMQIVREKFYVIILTIRSDGNQSPIYHSDCDLRHLRLYHSEDTLDEKISSQ